MVTNLCSILVEIPSNLGLPENIMEKPLRAIKWLIICNKKKRTFPYVCLAKFSLSSPACDKIQHS